MVAASASLPVLLAALPDAAALIQPQLQVAGEFVLEVFAGEAIFTLGLMMASVPCMRPWDVKFGDSFDVVGKC